MQLRIHKGNAALSEFDRALTERRLAYAVGRFANRLREVIVRFEDVNGHRGGRDTRCSVEARTVRSGVVTVETLDHSVPSAVSRAADRLARTLIRGSEKRRTRRRAADRAAR
jgi:putative sigma-54 modulation protein